MNFVLSIRNIMYTRNGAHAAVVSSVEPERNSMSAEVVTYASPKLAITLGNVFGDKASEVKVAVRTSKDVPKFLTRLAEVRKKTAQSTLRFK
jgi:hypothetical protein